MDSQNRGYAIKGTPGTSRRKNLTKRNGNPDQPTATVRSLVRRQQQAGVTLIEVMVAGLLLSASVTGLASARFSALETVARTEAEANLLRIHDSVIDVLRLNSDRAGNGGFDVDLPRQSSIADLRSRSSELTSLLDHSALNPQDAFLNIRCDAAPLPTRCVVCLGEFSALDRDADGDISDTPRIQLCGEVYL